MDRVVRHMVRVVLPHPLRILAGVGREISLEVPEPITQRSLLDALETRFPPLCGAIRDHVTQKRRPLVRFFACQEDLSDESSDALLPEAVRSGIEPFFILGAIAGG